jgi:hypothetical protein
VGSTQCIERFGLGLTKNQTIQFAMKYVNREDETIAFIVVSPFREIAPAKACQRLILTVGKPDADNGLGEDRIGIKLLRQLKCHATRIGVFNSTDAKPAAGEIAVRKKLSRRLRQAIEICSEPFLLCAWRSR